MGYVMSDVTRNNEKGLIKRSTFTLNAKSGLRRKKCGEVVAEEYKREESVTAARFLSENTCRSSL